MRGTTRIRVRRRLLDQRSSQKQPLDMVASEYGQALSTIENSPLEVDCHIVKTLRDADVIVFV